MPTEKCFTKGDVFRCKAEIDWRREAGSQRLIARLGLGLHQSPMN